MSLVGKFYRHYKGDFYFVICLSTHAATFQKHVVFSDLEGNIWNTSLESWEGSAGFNFGEGTSSPKFKEEKPTNIQLEFLREALRIKCNISPE